VLKIGEFSKLSRVSVRMLRYYDEIGLLKPAQIDKFTDYRYYKESQLWDISRITSLKNMGFSLTEIRKVLDSNDINLLTDIFNGKHKELTDQYHSIKNKLTLLGTAEDWLRKERNMKYDVTVKTFPRRYAASVHTVIPTYEDEGKAWEILEKETASMNLIPDDPCLCTATFYDEEYKEEDVEIEVAKTVVGNYNDTENVKFKILPPVMVATCIVNGGYENIGRAYGDVISWVKEKGYTFAGPMFNIYHVSPHETQNPEEFVTEVCFPIIGE